MRVLITGNLGYIGPPLVARLMRDGHDVVGLDAGWFQGDFAEPVAPPARQHPVDLRMLLRPSRSARRRLAALLEGVDAICHLAGVSNDPMADLHPAVTHEINFEMSSRFCTAAREAGVRRLVFYSSCSVYGDADGEVDESTPPRVLTPYAQSKVRLEHHLATLAGDAFHPIILRNATVFGYSPALRLDLIVNGMTAWGLTTGTVRLISTGSALRPQVHVQDVIDVTSAVLARDETGLAPLAGSPVNLGSNANNYSIGQLAEIVAARTGAVVRRDHDAFVDRRSYRVSFARLATLLPEAPVGRMVPGSIDELAGDYRRIALTERDVRSLRYTRLGQLQRALDLGTLDPQLRSLPRGVRSPSASHLAPTLAGGMD